MYKEFLVYKKSGTYAETLEAFGLAILINELSHQLRMSDRKIIIEDKGSYYSITTNKEIAVNQLAQLKYFQVVKFLIKNQTTKIPEGIPKAQCFDYPGQKAIQDWYKEEYASIDKNKQYSSEQKKAAKRRLAEQKVSEFGEKIDSQYDVYRELTKNPYASITKLYQNFHQNRNNFSELIEAILNKYIHSKSEKKIDIKLVDNKPTAQQLLNPNQGKGLNKNKANNASMSNEKSDWISETMKVSGALQFMTAQYVKVGSGYDLKLYVPQFKSFELSRGFTLMEEFKRHLKSNSPLKLDILNILSLSEGFIKLTPQYQRGKIKNTIQGFHSVYQKDLGQNKAVANISFINMPDFIEYHNREEGYEWVEIIKQQKEIVSSIEESGDSLIGLQNYRNFLGSTGTNAFNYFASFSFWYSGYFMQALSNDKYYVKAFKIETLNKFYKNMNTDEINLTEIIQNEGFQAVAKAIRKSTVTLQYTPKDQRKFEIRYGLAQQLQNKSKSKNDLATFIGEFIGKYNSETAQNAEKNSGKSTRANVKDEELIQFYTLLDNHSSRLIGALLTSYGFALNKKDAPKQEEQILNLK